MLRHYSIRNRKKPCRRDLPYNHLKVDKFVFYDSDLSCFLEDVINVRIFYIFYLKDGCYSIFHPTSKGWKISLFLGNKWMVNVFAFYHILISTCCANGIAALESLKNIFCEVVEGQIDYENLLPITIGINTNKL